MQDLGVITPLLTALTAKQLLSLALTNSELYNSLLSQQSKQIFTSYNNYPNYKTWKELVEYEQMTLNQKFIDVAKNNDSKLYFKLLDDHPYLPIRLTPWVSNNNLDMVNILMRKYVVYVLEEELHIAINNNNLPMFKELLTSLKLNDYEYYLGNLLVYSVKSYQILKYLLENYEFTNSDYDMAMGLLTGMEPQQLESVKLLLKYVTNNIYGLRSAVRMNHNEIANLLLSINPDNIYFILGDAIRYQNMEFIDKAIELGIGDYNEGLVIAIKYHNYEIAEMMIKQLTVIDKQNLLYAIRIDDLDIVKLLLPLINNITENDILNLIDGHVIKPETLDLLLQKPNINYYDILDGVIFKSKNHQYLDTILPYIDDVIPYVIHFTWDEPNIEIVKHLLDDILISIEEYNNIIKYIDDPEMIELLQSYIEK